MSEPKHSPLPWRLEITDDVDRESGLVYAKVVDADGDTVFGQWVWKGGLVQTNMAFLVESVNRRVPMPDAELEAIRGRWQRTTPGEWVYRQDQLDVVAPEPDPGQTGLHRNVVNGTGARRLDIVMERADFTFIAHAHQDVPRLLAENERLLGLLDDLFRDHGANPDETPTVRVWEENARLREALRKIVEMCKPPRTHWGEVADAMRDAAREALGEGV